MQPLPLPPHLHSPAQGGILVKHLLPFSQQLHTAGCDGQIARLRCVQLVLRPDRNGQAATSRDCALSR